MSSYNKVDQQDDIYKSVNLARTAYEAAVACHEIAIAIDMHSAIPRDDEFDYAVSAFMTSTEKAVSSAFSVYNTARALAQAYKNL